MIEMLQGDCLDLMKSIPDKSIDLVLTDPPYGTTACKWDSVIPFEPMWKELKRVRKDNAAICLFGSEPFSSHLRMSNIKEFKYDWVWEKNKATSHMNAKKIPMKSHELICIFYLTNRYFPQFSIGKPYFRGLVERNKTNKGVSGNHKTSLVQSLDGKRYPKSILKFGVEQRTIHPTQKPIALLEYLIKTYTLENESVLDFTMGSGSTGVACKNLNRNFIGIEKDDRYFEIAKNRIGATECS
jgi:site-specific DNA-methyltransferase (adenine-specific)